MSWGILVFALRSNSNLEQVVFSWNYTFIQSVCLLFDTPNGCTVDHCTG